MVVETVAEGSPEVVCAGASLVVVELVDVVVAEDTCCERSESVVAVVAVAVLGR